MAVARVGLNNQKFFKKLSARARKIADDESFIMAHNMKDQLVSRRSMAKGLGKSPLWDLPKPKSGRSHLKWYVSKAKSGQYSLINNAQNHNDDHYYARHFLTGNGWNPDVVKNAGGTTLSGRPSRLVRVGNKYFSTQMPKGINPWLRLKRVQLKNNIKREFKRLGVEA